MKFSAIKKHTFRPRKDTINWGGVEHETVVHDLITTSDHYKIKSETQRRDLVCLGMLAYAGITGKLRFHVHREVDAEGWGLPGMESASGRFFGCPIQAVNEQNWPQSRTIVGGTKTPKEHTLDFLSGIQHPRFVELTKMTGAFQGSSKPLNLNQALDAFHIWCAECARVNFFLTMDYKLQKVVTKSQKPIFVKIVSPYQLLRIVVPEFGALGGAAFIWNGYWFARSQLNSGESKGWQ